MRKILLSLLTLSVFVVFPLGSQHTLAAGLVQNCPVDGNNVMCLEKGGFLGLERCPDQNGVDYKFFGGGLLNCSNNYNCCIKSSVRTCPPPSFCDSDNLGIFGYKDAGVTCDDNGTAGKCWVVNIRNFDKCIPSPDECHSPQCVSGQLCKFEYDVANCNAGNHKCWKCVQDTQGICSPAQENTCVTEGMEDYRKCVDRVGPSACGDGWETVHNLSCGSSLKTCCRRVGQDCPVDGNEVMCLGRSGPFKCPRQNNVDYTLFGGGLLICDSGDCCVRSDVQTCPPPSFCDSDDLSIFGYKKAGVICDDNGTAGNCWVVNASRSYDQCIPSPDECNSPDCGSGYACRYAYDYNRCPSGNHRCWICVLDAQGLCEPAEETTCVTEETKTYRKCVDKVGPNACGTGWKPWDSSSCGSSLKTCCQKESVLCGPPGICIKGSLCPKDYEWLSACEKDSNGNKRVCCKKKAVDEPDPPKDAAYRGPLIDSLDKILGPIVKILYYGGLMIGIFYIILSGYRLMVSQGNPQQTQDAQEQLTAAILGIIFILLSVTILRVILGKVIGLSI
jgi:hypothetical protein